MVKNVLLITVDSLRTDHSHWKDSNPSRESISQMVDDSVCFERCFATGPGTTPSFPAMLTGTLPLSYGGLGPLKDERPRIGEKLRNEGLAVGGFHSNPFLSDNFNYSVGFNTFRDYQNPLMGIATKIFPRGIEINNPKIKKVDDFLNLTETIKKSYQLVMGKPRPYVGANVIAEDTIKWISQQESPFFCWSHYMDVHHPCFPPREYRKNWGVENVTQTEVADLYSALLRNPDKLTDKEIRTLQDLYDASISFTFDQIDKILEYLKRSGIYEDTLIIITSDHGELFGEYDAYGKPERMYDELLHVPLLIDNGPAYLAEAQNDMISLLDIPPLIHDALGMEIPDEYEGQLPNTKPVREYIMAEHEVDGDVIVGARSPEWLYEGDGINNKHRLFDLRNGKFEQVDRDHPGGDVVRDAVLKRLDSLDVDAKYLKEGVEGNVKNRLEELGYL